MKTIAKPVISAAGENCALDNSDAVASCLVRIFSQKRFLLVLDDVWNEDQEKWENLKMPSALKQCFAYCSIFPKDYEIDKDDLIRQWIALGFISSHETWTSMEDIGNEYFNDLLWMSFLQDVEENYRGVTCCRMHDLVHDLAQSVAKEEVAVISAEESARIPEGCRYASIHSRFTPQVSITVMQRLRALQFRESGSPIMTLYSEAKWLRLLDLHDSKISMLPSSIGKLKLLRYLNLSKNSIQELPESTTSLCNLQTLNLSRCREIRTLPKFLGRLTNLRI
uniref:Uncharacterized protein n=1 Tax=Ananas comosus var. bracteatus TaxID=296719 RepID=A0A6V7PDJ9_ANACO|nr:unnamed protein product [Ananas comosus var. bracteatus]